MRHAPVELRATPDAVLSLAKAVTHYRVEEFPGAAREDVTAVWFQADQLYLLTVDILGLAFKFEVFTFMLKTPAAALALMQANLALMEKSWAEMRAAGIPIPPIEEPVEPAPTGELQEWPFQSWRLDILKRNEFIVGSEHLPDSAEGVEEYFRNLGPGDAPPGSEHTCLTAMGLLFTSDDGRSLLIVADGMPGFMRVTDEEDVVQSYLRQCIAIPATEYVCAL